MSELLLSIVMPVYNVAPYPPACLNSLLPGRP
jgi:glycosyltransferase involved in cell wall biosynthesis